MNKQKKWKGVFIKPEYYLICPLFSFKSMLFMLRSLRKMKPVVCYYSRFSASLNVQYLSFSWEMNIKDMVFKSIFIYTLPNIHRSILGNPKEDILLSTTYQACF